MPIQISNVVSYSLRFRKESLNNTEFIKVKATDSSKEMPFSSTVSTRPYNSGKDVLSEV